MDLEVIQDSFIFDPRPLSPFRTLVKRYSLRRKTGTAIKHAINVTSSSAQTEQQGVTLIMAHAMGFHKEHFEPTIHHLWEATLNHESINHLAPSVAIREIWAIDCPNHGESAVLNDEVLRLGYDETFTVTEYARTLYLFLTGTGKGLPYPSGFQDHILIAVGHSMGANGLLLTNGFPSPPAWKGMILAEPTIFTESARKAKADLIGRNALKRRDIWPDKEAAYQYFLSRNAFKSWDGRVLKLYCEFGLRDLPTRDYPEAKQGVTLSCTKVQEAATYGSPVGLTSAYQLLSRVCAKVPVHMIYGDQDDFLAASDKEDAVNNAAKGKLASVRVVAGTGHNIVQVQPETFGRAIHSALCEMFHSKASNKL